MSETKGWQHGTPVYVQPLDPDGPKPGETWGYRRSEVEILAPATISSDGNVVEWWCGLGGARMSVRTDRLSPISPTRTVTVELTEEEMQAANELSGHYHYATNSTKRNLFRKLAEALEDR